MAKRSLVQAKNMLKRLFGWPLISARLSRAELFFALGKSDDNQKGRNAAYHAISIVKSHGLINKHYDENNSLTGISLTDKGKELLKNSVSAPRVPAPKQQAPLPTQSEVITLEHLANLADEYMKQNPSWIVDVTPHRKES